MSARHVLLSVVMIVSMLALPGEAAALAPLNDDFVGATVMAGEAGLLLEESNVDASAEPGEPFHDGVTPSRSVWYSWTPGVDGNAVVEATTQPYVMWDIVIGVYTGSAVDALTAVASDGGLVNRVEVEFPVTAGTTYRVAIDGQTSGETGSFDLSWSIPSPSNDAFASATTLPGSSGWLLDQTNERASAEPDEPTHAGRAPSRSVWYRWTPVSDGTAVVTASMHGLDFIVMAAYTGSALDSLTEVAAHGAYGFTRVRLEFPVLAGSTYHVVLDGYDEGETGTFDLTWALSPPDNDDFADPTVLAERNGSLVAESTTGATPEIGEPEHGSIPGTPAHSVWYEWTPIWDGEAVVDVSTPPAPDDWDAVVAVYTGDALSGLVEEASASTTGPALHLEFPVTGGTTYRLVVDGHDTNEFGDFDFAWAYAPYGGTWTVTKTDDTDDGACDADCSLREAVVASNGTGGDDTIHVPAGTYDLTLDSAGVAEHHGALEVERETGTTSILGAGRDVTVIDATKLRTVGVSFPDRVIMVDYHAGLELVGLTITGGYTITGPDKDGAGVLNINGSLTVTDCLIEGNVSGGNGGGIASRYGTATITNTVIRDNDTDPPEYATTGTGGGIYNAGTMTIVGSLVEGNASDWGGGVANELWLDDYPPSLAIENSTVAGNSAREGAGVANIEMMPGDVEASLTIVNSEIRDNRADRSTSFYNEGGGVLNVGFHAVTRIVETSITDNVVTAVNTVDPKNGSGGGVHNNFGEVVVVGSTIAGNQAICEQLPGDNDECGRGGGVLNSGIGRVTIISSTISGNSATLLGRTPGDWRGGGAGGAVSHARYCDPVCNDPTTTIIDTTITNNDADTGGGIDNTYEDEKLTVTNSIVAGNSGDLPGFTDCWGEYVSAGHNLSGQATGCSSEGPGDVTTLDPLLGPLADNGGPTSTHMPLRGSPAIDAGESDEPADQRGVSRPIGPADDIGAVEAPLYPNQPPELDPIGDQMVAEGGVLAEPVSASDPDGDALQFSISGQPAFVLLTDHGDGSATLSAAPGFDDAGSYPGVEIEVGDGTTSDTETITVTVTNTNRAPLADDQTVVTPEDVPVAITLTGSDPDGDLLDFAIGSGPSDGVVSGTPPNVTYSPDAGFAGSDAFDFVVDDGDLSSPPATVSITVAAAADTQAPVVRDVTVPATVLEDDPFALTATVDDRNRGDSRIRWARYSAAQGTGSMAASDGAFDEAVERVRATITLGSPGPAEVCVWAADASGNVSASVCRTIAVIARPDEPPVAQDDQYEVREDGELVVPVAGGVTANDHDPEGGSLTVAVARGPSLGSLTLAADGSFEYVPDPDVHGVDSFTYRLADEAGGTDTATVTITVTPEPDAPVTSPDAYVTDHETPLVVPSPGVLANDTDVDGDVLTAALASGPGHGTLTIDRLGGFAYTPGDGWSGTDTFTYVARDGILSSMPGQVSVTVRPPPAPPPPTTPPPVDGSDSFSDDNGSVFEADIEWLAARGITKGCDPPANTRFCPGDPVTRGQMAAFLVRALGYVDDGGGDLFSDDDGSVFEADIDRLAAAGVTKGCDPPANTRFCPGDPVTRGQMAAFLHRALG